MLEGTDLMFRESVRSLRESDTGEIGIDIYNEDQRINQYQQEVPLNHLDLPPDELPQTREDMKALLDRESRWLN